MLLQPQEFWLLFLLLVWGALLFGGFLFGRLNADSTHRMPTWTRMASSFTLVVAAWSGWLFTQSAPISSLSLLLAIGMTLGFIGDLFMAQLMPVRDFVIGGIAAFGLGHIAYIIGWWHFGDSYGLDVSGYRWGALVVWWLAGILGWYVVVFRGGERSVLHVAALPYALLLSTTAGVATGLALQLPLFVPLALGAASFLLSDLLLAAQLFNNLHFRYIGDVVWLLYGPAQMLIVYSLGSALMYTG